MSTGPEGQYDMLVVGSGPAGEKAAAQAAYFGKRVAIVDRAPAPGGAMVVSAVPAKAMREAALYLTGFTRHEVYGVGLELDPQAVIDGMRSRAAHVVAMMTEALVLQGGEKVLEIGTGSGYAAAVLSRMTARMASSSAVFAVLRSMKARRAA